MFYPNHHIRTYCEYLGSITIDGHNYDLGVYIQKDKTVSHAIVCGEDDSDYISGEFIWKGKLMDQQWKSKPAVANKAAYDELHKD
jgi:hypothetical protein